MLRSLYKNLWISSFVQCCYENYSAMQSNKRFNYSLVVPLLLLMWRVVLWRPGRDNWGIWVEYGSVVAAQLLFSLIFVCATVSLLLKAQQFSVEMASADDPDLKRVRTLQGKRTSRGAPANPGWLVRTKPLKLWKTIFRFGLICPLSALLGSCGQGFNGL